MRDLSLAVREGGVLEGEPMGVAVYQNNHWVSLINGMMASFPAVLKLIGEGNFKGLARQYLIQCPPKSKLMFELGGDFPSFLRNIDVGLPYLWEVAQIEVLWRESFHAEDAKPLTLSDFQALDLSRLAEMRFIMHDSLRIFTFSMASFSIYTDVMGLSSHAFEVIEPEEGVIIRPFFEVEGILLPPQSSLVLAKLQQGLNLSKAFEGLENFDINGFIQILITKNLVKGIKL